MHDLTDDQLLSIYESEWNTAVFNVKQCSSSVLADLSPLLLRLFGLTLLQSIIYRIKANTISNLIVVFFSLYLLFYQLNQKWMLFISIGYYFVSAVVDEILMGRKERGPTSIIIAICYIVGWQFQLKDVDFMQIRGSLMVMAMKLISFSFDEENCSVTTKMAYIFNPATTLFGPFISFRTFRNIIVSPNNLFQALFMSIIYCVLCLICVLYSTCFVDLIPTEILGDYATAQSYRFSHYFICYLSLSTVILSGMSTTYQTTKVTSIEFPRSMGEVVIYWNYSMHEFLHKYIFRKLINYGYFIAIIGSFLMSSLLHGFNFQLTAVLISLAFYAYAENVLRRKLANRLNACIKSRPCSEKCNHLRKNSSPLTFTLNMLFTILNIYHLIYLGMPFDGSAEEEGYSSFHTISQWKRWNFSSHIINLVVLFFGLLL